MDTAVEHRETSSHSSHPHDTPLHHFGATVRQYRQQRGMTQQELAARMGLHHRYISKIERGQRNIAVLLLLRLASALDIPVSMLLDGLDTHAAHQTKIAPVDPVASPPEHAAALLRLLGAAIRQYRQQRDLLQSTLATKTGLSLTYIGDIERGKRNISLLSLLRLAEAFEISATCLLASMRAS